MNTTATPTSPEDQEMMHIDALIQRKQYNEAAQALNEAQRNFPKDPRVFLLGMQMAERMGRRDGARAAGDRALQLAPNWPVALIEVGSMLMRQGEMARAVGMAERAVDAAPQELLVIGRALEIVTRSPRNDLSIDWLQRGLQLAPDHRLMRLTLAHKLMAVGRAAESLPLLDAMLQATPDDTGALYERVWAALALDNKALALQDAERLVALEPANTTYTYMRALARGETPATMPDALIQSQFDDAAPGFDRHVVQQLKYRLPEDVAKRLLALHPDRRFNLLDLGCGTGLLGLFLGPLNGHVIGVDLSQAMIAQAARHNVYSRFHTVNVLDALRETPPDTYEAVACLDTLIYVGDLTPVIPNAFRILKAGGDFIFSCEAAAEGEPDLVLRGNGRYAHQAAHAERLCREAGFEPVTVEALPQLRLEAGQPVPGFLVVAHKPA